MTYSILLHDSLLLLSYCRAVKRSFPLLERRPIFIAGAFATRGALNGHDACGVICAHFVLLTFAVSREDAHDGFV
jgi:hypothetical protein